MKTEICIYFVGPNGTRIDKSSGESTLMEIFREVFCDRLLSMVNYFLEEMTLLEKHFLKLYQFI